MNVPGAGHFRTDEQANSNPPRSWLLFILVRAPASHAASVMA